MPSYDHFKSDSVARYAEPQPGESVIYFYREKKFIGSGVTYYLLDGDKKIGGLKTGMYFYYVTPPGSRTLCAETEAKVCKTIELEPDETYYIRGDVEWGVWIGRPTLTIVSEIEGKSTIPHLDYVTLMSDEEIKAVEASKKSIYD